MTGVSSTNYVSRSTIVQYAEVLTTLDELVSTARALKSDGADNSIITSHARQIVQVVRQLVSMENTSLSSTDEIQDLARALTIRSARLTQIVDNPGSTLVQIASAFSDWLDGSGESGDGSGLPVEDLIKSALDPTNWDSNLEIRDSITDFLFFEYYRSAEVAGQEQIGLLGNRLQISEKFLESLNLVYQGSTWNPGEEFIDVEGNLKDSGGESWFARFEEDGIRDQMSQGVSNIRTMLDAGLLPEGSSTYDTAIAILDKWDTSTTSGGIGALATQDAVARMWGDSAFLRTVQDGINATSDLNDRLQNDISRLIMDYDTFTRSASQMASRMNSSIRTIARSVQNKN